MKVNSDTAHKILKNTQSEVERILGTERENRTYAHSPNEEPIRVNYSFEETQTELEALNGKIGRIKHAIGLFNQTTEIEVEGEKMTIDEALSQMKWLNSRKKDLDSMLAIPEVQRQNTYGNKLPDIVHRNFDAKAVQATYERISNKLIATQQAINIANLTVMFEIEL